MKTGVPVAFGKRSGWLFDGRRHDGIKRHVPRCIDRHRTGTVRWVLVLKHDNARDTGAYDRRQRNRPAGAQAGPIADQNGVAAERRQRVHAVCVRQQRQIARRRNTRTAKQQRVKYRQTNRPRGQGAE